MNELVFENIHALRMPDLLSGIGAIAAVTHCDSIIEVQCTGKDRTGELVFLNREYHLLAENKVTSRKQYFNIIVDGKVVAVRPENDTFTSVKISYVSTNEEYHDRMRKARNR